MHKKLKALGKDRVNVLLKMAVEVAKNSYSPYSKYKVGAAGLAKGGEMFAACNCECASYGLTDCAESSLIDKMISEGMEKKQGRKFLKAVVVVTKDGGTSCGRCRQRLVEHADNILIIAADLKGKIVSVTGLKDLLPQAFTPDNLGF